jgi:membrane associated rhomboid family serine protease
MFEYTIGIILVTGLVSIAGFRNQQIINGCIFYPPAIQRGQYYRFITCGFIHANIPHLAFNMITLYFFGRAMEVYYMGDMGLPHYTFLVLYLGALVFSSLPTYLKHRNDSNYRSLGASGAVCAVLFAFILLKPWVTIYVFVIPVPAIIYAVLFLIYSVYMSRKGGDYINHDAHFYGALFGIVFTICVHPSNLGNFIEQLSHPHFNM